MTVKENNVSDVEAYGRLGLVLRSAQRVWSTASAELAGQTALNETERFQVSG